MPTEPQAKRDTVFTEAHLIELEKSLQSLGCSVSSDDGVKNCAEPESIEALDQLLAKLQAFQDGVISDPGVSKDTYTFLALHTATYKEVERLNAGKIGQEAVKKVEGLKWSTFLNRDVFLNHLLSHGEKIELRTTLRDASLIPEFPELLAKKGIDLVRLSKTTQFAVEANKRVLTIGVGTTAAEALDLLQSSAIKEVSAPSRVQALRDALALNVQLEISDKVSEDDQIKALERLAELKDNATFLDQLKKNSVDAVFIHANTDLLLMGSEIILYFNPNTSTEDLLKVLETGVTP